MKKIIPFLLVLLISTQLFSQFTPQIAPLNPDFVKYLNEKNAGTRKTVTKDGYGLGEIPSAVIRNFSGYVSTKALVTDEVYDLRTAGPGGTSLLTSVKNQGACGACWTFAAMGSLESRLKILGHGTYDLSEDNMNNCHAFDFLPCEGGNLDMVAAYLARKSGPMSEADDPYVQSAGTCPTGLYEQFYIPDIRFLPKITNTIKQAIIDYGALYTNMFWDDPSYNGVNNTYYYNGATGTNHAVLLVGWDDNKVTAGGTGAWIIRNSWSAGWGESGFFYISYNDVSVNTTPGYFPSSVDYNANAHIYTYDKFGALSGVGYSAPTGYGLIKYTATGNQTITKIGTWVNDANTTIDIQIYNTFNGTTLSDLQGSLTGQVCDLPGYYTFNLSSPVSITNGSDFYILVKYYTPGATQPVPIEMTSPGYASPVIESGKCWISPNGTSGWTLIGASTASYKWDLCINAYTTEGPDNPLDFTATSAGTEQIDVSWSLNSNSDDVILAYNTSNTFGIPTDGTNYSAADVLSGGGTIIYSGSGTSFNHNELNSSTTYYYKIWSKDDDGKYSGGATANAQTTCLVVTAFPMQEDFTSITSCPTCWEVIDNEGNGQVWQFGTFTPNPGYSVPFNSTANYAYIDSDGLGDGYTQNSDLITPTFDFSGYTDVNLSFNHYHLDYGSTAKLYYSIDNGSNWTMIGNWTNISTDNPETFNMTIAALAGQSQVKFKWNYIASWAYHWCIDDINVTATASSSLTVSNTTHNVSSNMAYQNVTVAHDGNLTVDADKILTVAGNFIIESDASGTGSFIDNGSMIIQGNTEVHRFLSYDINDLGWYLSAPIENPSDNILRTDADALYFFNSPAAHWDPLPVSSSLTPMVGYVARYKNYGEISGNKTLNFTGTDLNNGTFTNANLVRTTTPVNYGWNLIGNPYPSPVDWDLVVGTDNGAFINSTHLNPTIYLRSHDGSVVDYMPNMVEDDPNRIIPSMQAFWVQVNTSYTSASLTLNNSYRVHGANELRKSTSNNFLSLKVEREGLENFKNETKIFFKEGATENYDGAYDAVKMFSENPIHPQIYSLLATQEELSINSYPELTSNRSVALGFNTEVSGIFSITAENVNSFQNNASVILEDTYDNIFTDMSLQNAYTFSSGVIKTTDRFVLHFNLSTSDNITNSSCNEVNIYTYDNAVYITNVNDNDVTLCIYNVLGQEVVSQHLSNAALNKVNTVLTAGQYIVKVMSKNGVTTQKVFLK